MACCYKLGTYGKFNARLVSGYESKNMVFCSGKDTFKDGKVGNHTAGVEVLEAIENEVVSFISNTKIAISGIYSAFVSVSLETVYGA